MAQHSASGTEHVITVTLYHPAFGNIPCGHFNFLGTRTQALAWGHDHADWKRTELGATRATVEVLS